MRKRTAGFTLIELLIVVVIIGLLAAIALPKMSYTKEKAYVSTMKSDLRNLATVQESYWNDNASYYAGSIPGAGFTYNSSPTVTVTITEASAAGWAAQASHVSTTVQCALFSGTASPPAPATIEGRIACQ
jgi:prepilin-type N-terminal cleavage/methylation domain-containing protein